MPHLHLLISFRVQKLLKTKGFILMLFYMNAAQFFTYYMQVEVFFASFFV